jgi:aryl-alcohol dehydrogenase-like predicted oxidoreductase
MERRTLGARGPEISAIGLGCMGMSEFYGPSDDLASIELIRRAVDLGIDFIDTADMYGSGHNEMLLAQALRGGYRRKVFLATKFGNMRRIDGASLGINGRPEYVRAACDMSLKRLGVDHIDLYYQHRVDPEVPIEETVGAMAELVAAGKVRFLGLSEAGAETIRRAHAVHPIAALQSEYSLWTRDPEGAVLEACRSLGIAFVAYSPLGRGFLTGRLGQISQLDGRDVRRSHPRMSEANLERNLGLVRKLEAIAARRKVPDSQLALAWVLSRGKDIIPIPGTRHEAYLLNNIAAAELRLDAPELEELDRAFPPVAAAGERYTAEGMKRIGL